MQRRGLFATMFLACSSLVMFTATTNGFSDWIGVYARVDKVVFEPASGPPERVQIWGAFAFATREDRNNYEPAERGYLYFSLAPGKEEISRKEWADLRSIAAGDQIIGFGARSLTRPRLRKPDDQPADPDVYPVASGLVKMSQRSTDYAPIRDLRSLPKGQN